MLGVDEHFFSRKDGYATTFLRFAVPHRLRCWREIDPVASKNRGVLSLMRRHRHNLKPEQLTRLEAYFEQFPVIREIYRFKQRLCYLLLKKHRTRRQCVPLAKRFLKALHELRQAYGFRNFNDYRLRVKTMCS